MNIETLKRAPAGCVNTPLEYMPRLTRELGGGRLYIKRDDLTGLALGGNKARKLDYIVQYALDNGYTGGDGRPPPAAAPPPPRSAMGSSPSWC